MVSRKSSCYGLRWLRRLSHIALQTPFRFRRPSVSSLSRTYTVPRLTISVSNYEHLHVLGHDPNGSFNSRSLPSNFTPIIQRPIFPGLVQASPKLRHATIQEVLFDETPTVLRL